jgi:prephenate dehydratase
MSQNKAEKMEIGVSGARGSFSEEAAQHYCSENKIENYSLKYLIGVENVLTALEEGEIALGVFPIENSNGGIVLEAVYAMAKHQFEIEKIFEIDIKMNLMTISGTPKKEIKRIISHQQALRQCRMYLKRIWPKAELEEYSDTASAAKDLSAGKFPKNSAVVAPKICAKLYNLELLEEGIQDLKFNFTTFIVATKK